MNRILITLGALAVGSVAAALILGLSLGDVTNPADRFTQRMATVHRLSGVAAALLVVLVDSIVVTYFIGTSRWCREVSETYSLDGKLALRANQLKRRTFPWLAISMLVAVGVTALGAAADPGASLQLQPLPGLTWAQVHLVGALLGLAYIAYAFTIAWNNVRENGEVIHGVMREVAEVRSSRGLDVGV